MRLLRIRFLLLLFIPFLSCDTAGDFEDDFKKYFIKYYGEDGDQEAVDFVINDDGTVLLLGNTIAPDGKKKISLIKVDAEGNVRWQKKIGSGKDLKDRAIDENAQDIEAIVDGSSTNEYLILSNMYRGDDQSTNEKLYDFKVIRIRDLGTGVQLVDSMEFGNFPIANPANEDERLNGDWKTQFIRSITPLSTGGFLVTGNTTNEDVVLDPVLPSPPPDLEDVLTIKFNDLYSFAWSTIEPASYGEHYGSGVKVFERPTEYILFGYSDKLRNDVTGGDNTFDANFNVFRVSDLGATTASYYSGTNDVNNEVLGFVCEVPNALGGGYYEIGTSTPALSTATEGQLYFCKRNSGMTKVGEGTIGISGDFMATSVSPTSVSEGFLILANEVTAFGKVIRLTKVNVESQPQWSVSLGSRNKEGNNGARVAELPDGRILVFGTIELETQKKMALIKLNSKGELLD